MRGGDRRGGEIRNAPTVSGAALIRMGGLAAVLAGVLRTLASFIPHQPGVALELFYLAIDLLILFGIFGVYARVHESAGVAGFVGFVLATTGTAAIVGPDGDLGGVPVYQAGSAILVVGLAFLAAGTWRDASLPRWVCVLWVLDPRQLADERGLARGRAAVHAHAHGMRAADAKHGICERFQHAGAAVQLSSASASKRILRARWRWGTSTIWPRNAKVMRPWLRFSSKAATSSRLSATSSAVGVNASFTTAT